MRSLKVYGWQGHRYECSAAPNGSKQTREIVAARSMAEAARLSGHKRPAQMFNLCVTGNLREIATAMARPGVVFWQSLNARGYDEFQPAAPPASEGESR